MKQSDEVQEMNHQRRTCAFQGYYRYEQEHNQKDSIYHIRFHKKVFLFQLFKLNMINCILLVLLLLVSMVLLKCKNFPLVIHFLNFARLFHLQVFLIIILPVSFLIFFHLQFVMITLAKILFLLFFKLKMQIFPKSFFFPMM